MRPEGGYVMGHHPDAVQTRWSSPRRWASRLDELPATPMLLTDALEEFVIHHAVARALGFGVPAYAESDRDLRTVAALIRTAICRDPRGLTLHRDLPAYLYVTCRDFALLATSALRYRGVPARLRVGFASYFRRGFWEDHWICEYWTGARWARLDAQLGRRARAGMGIHFDVTDVPESNWQSAAALWKGVRNGSVDPSVCGLSYADIRGSWFIAAAVVRDAAAVAGVEPLPWDYWGPAAAARSNKVVPPDLADEIDALAECLEPAPRDRRQARRLLQRFDWARPPETFGFVGIHERGGKAARQDVP
jgi:hypothetical protein